VITSSSFHCGENVLACCKIIDVGEFGVAGADGVRLREGEDEADRRGVASGARRGRRSLQRIESSRMSPSPFVKRSSLVCKRLRH